MSSMNNIELCFGSSFEILLTVPKQAIDDICQSGPNDDAVEHWHKEVDFSGVDKAQLHYEVQQVVEYTTHFTEHDYEIYGLWLACWDYFDKDDEDES